MPRGKKKAEKPVETDEMSADKILEATIAAMEKQLGKGIIMTNRSEFPEIERISTGCISLDEAIGGGLPRGRIIEIYGPESSGKTTLALHAIAQAQKEGIRCAFVDVEHALDVKYAEALGVNLDEILISQPDSAEQCLSATDFLVRSGQVHLIVVDSVAALTPKAELEGDMGDSHMGLQARLMSQAMRKLNGIVYNQNAIVIFINQIRMKIGVMFGSPETVSGGNALKFYASVRLDTRRIGTIKQGDNKTGNRTRVKVVKCKVAPPFRETEFTINFGTGIDWADDLLGMAVKKGIVKKSGAWFSYKDSYVGQGTEKASANIREDAELAEELRSLVSGNQKEESDEVPTSD